MPFRFTSENNNMKKNMTIKISVYIYLKVTLVQSLLSKPIMQISKETKRQRLSFLTKILTHCVIKILSIYNYYDTVLNKTS